MKKFWLVVSLVLLLAACAPPRSSEQVQIAGVQSMQNHGQEYGRAGYDPQHPFVIPSSDGHTPSSMNVVRILDESLMRVAYRREITGDVQHSVRKIAIERMGVRPTATSTKEVWAMIRNETDYDLQLECRVSWFDQYQAPLEAPSGWQRIYLNANSIGTYTEMSIRTDVVYFIIDIREAR